MGQSLKLEMNRRERHLARKYGYPFDEIASQLEAKKNASGDVVISASHFEWEQLVGNLSISVNEDVRDQALAEELDELASRIEFELQYAGKRLL